MIIRKVYKTEKTGQKNITIPQNEKTINSGDYVEIIKINSNESKGEGILIPTTKKDILKDDSSGDINIKMGATQ